MVLDDEVEGRTLVVEVVVDEPFKIGGSVVELTVGGAVVEVVVVVVDFFVVVVVVAGTEVTGAYSTIGSGRTWTYKTNTRIKLMTRPTVERRGRCVISGPWQMHLQSLFRVHEKLAGFACEFLD